MWYGGAQHRGHVAILKEIYFQDLVKTRLPCRDLKGTQHHITSHTYVC